MLLYKGEGEFREVFANKGAFGGRRELEVSGFSLVGGLPGQEKILILPAGVMRYRNMFLLGMESTVTSFLECVLEFERPSQLQMK